MALLSWMTYCSLQSTQPSGETLLCSNLVWNCQIVQDLICILTERSHFTVFFEYSVNNGHDISGIMPWHKPYIVSAGNLNVLKQSTNFQNWGSELSGLKISSSLSLSAISITSFPLLVLLTMILYEYHNMYFWQPVTFNLYLASLKIAFFNHKFFPLAGD